MNSNDMKTEQDVAVLCSEIQDRLNELQKKGYAGTLLITAPDRRPYMVSAGNPGELLALIAHTAVPSLIYQDSCSKADSGAFLRDVTSTVTEKMEE